MSAVLGLLVPLVVALLAFGIVSKFLMIALERSQNRDALEAPARPRWLVGLLGLLRAGAR